MVGLVGRSSILLGCRLGQYSKRCILLSKVPSESLSQFFQPILSLLYFIKKGKRTPVALLSHHEFNLTETGKKIKSSG